MYDSKLWKIMEAYEHMDEFPCKIHETVHVYDIQWDEDDLAEAEELADVTSEDVDIEYVQQYEGDHTGRGEEIDKYFAEFYGCVPTYETRLDNAEVVESINSSIFSDDEYFADYVRAKPGAKDYSIVFGTNGRRLAKFANYKDAEIFLQSLLSRHPEMEGILKIV